MQTVLPRSAARDATTSVDMRFIGNATMLLRIGPFTVLTDPNFLRRGQYAYLGYGLVSRRRTQPAIPPGGLPPIDLVLLSHLHGDHFDRVAMRQLPHDVPLATTGPAARTLRRRGFRRAAGLPAWSSKQLVRGDATLLVHAVPAHHAHGAVGALLPPVVGFVAELFEGGAVEPAYRLYISGDTLLAEDLAEIPARFPSIDAAVVHLGGTRILGFLVTLDAEQGVELVRLIHADVVVPVHYDDYGVFRSPLSDFTSLLAERLPSQLVAVVGRGDSVTLAARRTEPAPV